MSRRTALGIAAAAPAGVAAYAKWIRPRQLTWGARPEEVDRSLSGMISLSGRPSTPPGDLDQAPPEQVWPWLVQAGLGRAGYQQLVDRIRADGWQVENYQFPLIADERQAGSTVLQRLALVDVATDREVDAVFLVAAGAGARADPAYGPGAAAIAAGATGGRPGIPGSPQMPALNWEELAGDLRLARHFCDQILIHSLEGCVWQGFLPGLRSFEWADVEGPPDGTRAAAALRRGLRATLRASAHPWPVLGITAAAALLAWRWRRG